MGYFALAFGLLCLLSGLTGKILPLKRPSLIEVPTSVHRVIYVWMGFVLSSFGVFLIVEGHRK